jgi:hypothetical protein
MGFMPQQRGIEYEEGQRRTKNVMHTGNRKQWGKLHFGPFGDNP